MLRRQAQNGDPVDKSTTPLVMCLKTQYIQVSYSVTLTILGCDKHLFSTKCIQAHSTIRQLQLTNTRHLQVHSTRHTGPCESSGAQNYQASTGVYWPATISGISWSTTLQHINWQLCFNCTNCESQGCSEISILEALQPLIPTPSNDLPRYHSPSPAFAPMVSSQSTSEPYRTWYDSHSNTQQPAVESPFWLAFNVSQCNGCKGRIFRDQNEL